MNASMISIPTVNYILLFLIMALYAFMIFRKWEFIESTMNAAPDSGSQKRLVIFLCTLTIITIALMAVLLKVDVPEMIWWGLLSMVAAGLGITAWEKVKIAKGTPPGTS